MAGLRVAAVQLTSTDDVVRNLRVCADLVADAAARGASLVALPENFAFLGDEKRKLEIAERLDEAAPGTILGALARLAREHRVWLLGGGMPERTSADPARVHNCSVLLDDAGRLAARYRKIHLFDVAIPGRAEFTESATVAPGDEPVVADTPFGRVGLTVCYDLRFPELYRELSRRGSRVLLVPSAFTQYTGSHHWHVLLRARAIENLCFVVAPAQFGKHNERRTTYGHALVVDPWGAILAEAEGRECAVVADLDFELQDRLRRELPSLDHRRM